MINELTLDESKQYIDNIIKINMDLNYIQRITHVALMFRGLGVNIDEDTDVENDDDSVYFSVPEKLEVTLKNGDKLYITADNYKICVREKMIDVYATMDDEVNTEEFMENRKFISEEITFYAKVRKGEIWTDEDITKETIKIQNEFDLLKSIRESYEEVQ